MSEESLSISVPADNDGFVSFNCPHCEKRFKLLVADYESDDVINLFCPACGLPDQASEFISKEAKEAAIALAKNLLMGKVDEMFKGLEKSFRGSSSIQMKRTGGLPMEPEKVLTEENDLERVHFACCKRDIKIHMIEKAGVIYCPYCGVNP